MFFYFLIFIILFGRLMWITHGDKGGGREMILFRKLLQSCDPLYN
jgi:hypothetical protein